MRSDVLYFSDRSWADAVDRGQHLLVRFARFARVFFVEPLVTGDTPMATVQSHHGVHVIAPAVPADVTGSQRVDVVRDLLGAVVRGYSVEAPIAWLATPAALPLIDGLPVSVVIYEAAPEHTSTTPEQSALEAAALVRADLVFTGGRVVAASFRSRHAEVHCFPAGVDPDHFGVAAATVRKPIDQAPIARPRIGCYAPIDTRLDLELVRTAAASRPAWQFVFLGRPTVEPAALPQAPNIHYLGFKPYDELPSYLAGWDAAILPYSLTEATRALNPMQIAAFLAAGVPVISTALPEVVVGYGPRLVHVADTAESFVKAIAVAMTSAGRATVDRALHVLPALSWDATVDRMRSLIEDALVRPRPRSRREAHPLAAFIPAPASRTPAWPEA